jgi:hypothetical protein
MLYLFTVENETSSTKGKRLMNRTSTNTQDRFYRAVQMLSLAISHVLYGNPDAARTNLRASWDSLKQSAVGRIEHMATAAFVSAVDGNVGYAVHVLGLTMNELRARHRELPPVVRQWVWDRCVLTMERLPYAIGIRQMVGDAYNRSAAGNYAEALHLLTQAGDELKRVSHLTPPQLREEIATAWNDVLERMLTDETASALACVREFSSRYGQPAAA